MSQFSNLRHIQATAIQGKAAENLSLERIAAKLDAAAAAQDAGTGDIAGSIDILRQAGWLTDTGSLDPALTVDRLRRLGGANLSVGRLWEGHVNALYLMQVHGTPDDVAWVEGLVEDGAFLGVWGADGSTPVAPSADGTQLAGHKVFASGLGIVTHAVVTVSSGPDVRLGVIDVRDQGRADPSTWKMQGMRATVSGRYDFEGIALRDVIWLGQPGDYIQEPHFIGGVWRIGALQVGGALGLLESAASELRARNRLEAPAQMARLSQVAISALGASALVTRAALAATAGAAMAPDDAAALSAASRLLSEELGLDAIRAVEQSLGLAHFEQDSITGRKARDLSVYLRQAARDAFQTRVGEACLNEKDKLWTLF